MSVQKQERMRELTKVLNRAGKAYYQDGKEIMSNFEYDRLYDELKKLEEETGTVLSDSPTIHVGYEVQSQLPKERHESPMLSLDKTKEVPALADFLGTHKGVLSWKMDGLTIVLSYVDGQLAKAVTRGNGEVGEVVTANARAFANIPLRIPYKGELVLRGEAVIRYSDFEKINREIEDVDARYKNPRNLCSGSVRQLNSEITAKRKVHFYAFSLVSAPGIDFDDSRVKQFEWLLSQGFSVVEYKVTDAGMIAVDVQWFSDQIVSNDFPSDGLVLIFDDIAYGQSLGRTAKFPRDAIAFKWADEIQETTLLEIEWSPSRTGLINPVAIFEPVELEGTTVSRASVHNLSVMEELELGIGDRVQVYKANMIIPQIADNLTRSGRTDIPKVCPVCGGATEIRQDANARTLVCTNPDCQAKHMKSYSLMVSRDALNIEGLSEATLEKFVARGFIKEYADLFRLERFREEICEMEGFGEKSFSNLMDSIEKARSTTLPRLIYALGIPGIGLAGAKMICKAFKFNLEAMEAASPEVLSEVDGVGEVLAAAWVSYFINARNMEQLEHLLAELHIAQEEQNSAEQVLEGKTFVITGSVEHFANRNEVKALIESLGGKVTGSVTSKTDYLINNDTTSTSSKNKKARELGIAIISEKEFMAMAGGGKQ